MSYLDLMQGAGLGDVLIPKEEFIKEHERLIKLLNSGDKKSLRKEAKEQQAELATRGGSGKSNYIARLMAEAKYKHRKPSEKDKPYDKSLGEYKKPVMNPETDETQMNRADVFDYDKIANKNQVQSGKNKAQYGASPFIVSHFGHATVPKPKESALQKQARKDSILKRKALQTPQVAQVEQADEEKKEPKERFVSTKAKAPKAPEAEQKAFNQRAEQKAFELKQKEEEVQAQKERDAYFESQEFKEEQREQEKKRRDKEAKQDAVNKKAMKDKSKYGDLHRMIVKYNDQSNYLRMPESDKKKFNQAYNEYEDDDDYDGELPNLSTNLRKVAESLRYRKQ